MQFTTPPSNIFTLPAGATSGQRIVINGTLGCILIYDNNNNLIYSIAPVGAGATNVPLFTDGTPAANAVLPGTTSYVNVGSIKAIQVIAGQQSFLTATNAQQMTPWADNIDFVISPTGIQLNPSGNPGGLQIQLSGAPATSFANPVNVVNGLSVDELVGPTILRRETVNPTTSADGSIVWGNNNGEAAIANADGWIARLSSAPLASTALAAVTQNVMTNLYSNTIPGGPTTAGPTGGSRWSVSAEGFGTWGSTQQALTFGIRFGALATNIIGSVPAIAATAFPANTPILWQARAYLTCVTAGVTATWRATLVAVLSSASSTVSVVGGTGSTDITLDSTIAEIFGISCSWASTTGAPTITKNVGVTQRVN